MTDQTRELLAAVLADLSGVVGGINERQLHNPTPCTDYDVAQLREHVQSWLTTFADAFAGQPAGNQPETITAAADRMDQALRAGAASRPLRLGDSAMPGDMALSMILWEYQVHGWDLARATSQPWSPPAAAAQESLSFAPSMLTADYQGPGKAFAPPVTVPDTAPAFDRLLGLSGRDPAWESA